MRNLILTYWKKLRNDRQGFTLIEMLIVLIVVALLMAIIIPNVAGQRDRIDEQARDNITEIIDTQKSSYQMVEQSTPTLEQLFERGYITEKQMEEALKYDIE